jgi:hypothetical protein
MQSSPKRFLEAIFRNFSDEQTSLVSQRLQRFSQIAADELVECMFRVLSGQRSFYLPPLKARASCNGLLQAFPNQII